MAKVAWLQASCCGGETTSLLNAEQPDVFTALQTLDLELVWHPLFSERGENAPRGESFQVSGSGDKVDVLVVEGAVPINEAKLPAPFEQPATSVAERIRQLSADVDYVVAAGTCASFGGILAAGGGSVRMTGLQFLRDKSGGLLGTPFRSGKGLPVVNVPGCPAHPDWIICTLGQLARGNLREEDLDVYGRPKMFYGKLAHHGCPRNEYYEFKASATEYSQQGCLFENLGCKGTQCDSDCNQRLWLSRTGSCPRGGFPCLSCTSPRFPDGFVPFFETQKIGNVPTTLPLDVPKAWYVGISGLAKLACPARLSANAVSFKPVDVKDAKE